MTPYYRKQLKRGLEYQDFIHEMLWRAGIGTVAYSSRLFQTRVGENKAQIEIKYDSHRARTGNLYFEVAEKTDSNNPSYVTSGIYRDCVEYVIGDYDVAYRCPVRILRAVHAEGRYRTFEIPRRTSKGFLMPEREVEPLAIQVFKPQASGGMRAVLERARALEQEEAQQLLATLRKDPKQGTLF